MKKICVMILNLSYICEIERVHSVIANMLSKNQNYNVTLLSLFGDKTDSQFNLTTSDKVNGKWLFKDFLHISNDALKIIKIIESGVKLNRYDINVSTNLRRLFAYIKIKNRSVLKLILWEHFTNYKIPSFTQKCTKKIKNMVIDKIIVLTERGKEPYFNIYGYPNKVQGIYNPFNLVQEANPDLRYNRNLTVSRLNSQKGLDFIIEIGKNIFKHFLDWCWDIYDKRYPSDFPYKLIKANAIENNIFFKGVCSGAKAPNTKRSIFGLTLVTFDINCCSSVIIKNDLNGYLIPPI